MPMFVIIITKTDRNSLINYWLTSEKKYITAMELAKSIIGKPINGYNAYIDGHIPTEVLIAKIMIKAREEKISKVIIEDME